MSKEIQGPGRLSSPVTLRPPSEPVVAPKLSPPTDASKSTPQTESTLELGSKKTPGGVSAPPAFSGKLAAERAVKSAPLDAVETATPISTKGLPCHPAFEIARATRIPTMKDTTVIEYVHKATGARHVHIAAPDRENGAIIAFRTPALDSTGHPHVLEHLVLCGGERYPVRDPFFSMMRQTLQTHMNASTADDYTYFHFASAHPKSFHDLFSMYMDATFFPNLHPLDFAQEGTRVHFRKPEDPKTRLVYDGIVYNEMKAARAAPRAQLAMALQTALFPDNAYRFDSGGDPRHIPELTHEQLVKTHHENYHPTNATFITYGDLPAVELQEQMEDEVLHRFDRRETIPSVAKQKPFTAPRVVEQAFASAPGKTREKDSIVNLGWAFGDSTDVKQVLEGHLLSTLLMGNSAAPLAKALETTSLGKSLGQCYFDDSLNQLTFYAGLDGCNAEDAPKIEALILDTLREVAEKGLPQETVKTAVDKLELSSRTMRPGSPRAMQVAMAAMGPAMNGKPAAEGLDLGPQLAELRKQLEDPSYVKGLARQLLENPHRVRVTLTPDPKKGERARIAEERRLSRLKSKLSPEEVEGVVQLYRDMQARQAIKDDPSLLPRTRVRDVPRKTTELVKGEQAIVAGHRLTTYPVDTGGVVYQRAVLDLAGLSDEQLELLPIYAALVTEVGAGKRDYLTMQKEQAARTLGLEAGVTVKPDPKDAARVKVSMVLDAEALPRNQGQLNALMRDTLMSPRFDELDRLRDLVAQLRARRETGLLRNSMGAAISAAAAPLSPVSALEHEWTGAGAMRRLNALDRALEDPKALREFASKLEALHEVVRDSRREFVVAADENALPEAKAALARAWEKAPAAQRKSEGLVRKTELRPTRELWATGGDMNARAKSYPAVGLDHPDAGPLSVLGHYLTNEFLHRAIREEGGAYGGVATYSSNAGTFNFLSYRDPRLDATLKDFDRSLDWLKSHTPDPLKLEEAILSVVQGLDAPSLPWQEAFASFANERNGRTTEKRQAFRDAVLSVTVDDLRRVAAKYLVPDKGSVAVVNRDTDPAEKLRLAVREF